MTPSAPNPQCKVVRHLSAAVVLLGALLLLSASSASAATWEKVQNFSPLVATPPEPPSWPEEVQLGGASGMAVNVTGAGGVEPGTVYTVGYSGSEGWHAARFSAKGDFELAWNRARRCGPEAEEPANETCPAVPSGISGETDIALDQSTGNIYIFYIFGTPTVIREYRPDGTGPIAEFGEYEPGGTASSSPAKIHGSPGVGSIAVDDAGTVYVLDEDTSTDFFHRLMVFKPETPGDYEHYVYAGKGADIAAGFLPSRPPYMPVVDDAGEIYVAGGGDSRIEKYDPGQPANPVCSFSLPAGGISAITVNQATGAPFYYSFKNRQVHQLTPCNGEGKFVEKDAQGNYVQGQPFSPSPQRGNLEALAVNPTFEFSPGRAGGVLYAGASEPCPPIGSCPPEAQGQSALGYIFAPAVSLKPVVEAEFATQVGLTAAQLNAEVNPKGSQTSYIFQYLTDAAYQANDPSDRFAGAFEAPVGGGQLGTGQQPLPAVATVSDLEPGTDYHFRVVATNGDGTTEGSPEAFRTLVAGEEGLPDGRVWELVSPVNKNGGEVLPGAPNQSSCGECKPGVTAKRFPVQVAADGSQIVFQGSPFIPNEGASEFDEYLSVRGPSGWSTITPLSPPLAGDSGGVGFEAFDFTDDLRSGLVTAQSSALTGLAPPGYANLFAQPTADRLSLSPLLTTAPPNRSTNGANGFAVRFTAATADHARVFFEANDALTGGTSAAPAAVDGGPKKYNLYEWSGGELKLVNVLPGNLAMAPGATFGSGRQLASGTVDTADFSNAISADGSRVFWSSEGGQVYVREAGQATTELPNHTGKFVSASVDGSKVLLSDGSLYDLDAKTSTDLTGGKGEFKGIVGQSSDLSSIYFVDSAVLTSAPNDHGDLAQVGQDNLYLWTATETRFVGILAPDDNGILGVWKPSPVQRSAEASPDGSWLAFVSKAALTGFDNVGACDFDPVLQKYVGAVPCEEVFLYDSASGELLCASCNPSGTRPLGGSFLRLLMNSGPFLAQPYYLSNSGRLLFDSRDSLSQGDLNNGVEDVYQYEPPGVGGCAKAGGCVSLISSGRGPYDSNFLAMDGPGNNVFFTTRQALVPRDQDELVDLYDARVGGGESESTPSIPCSGDSCQPVVPVVSEPLRGSNTFEGTGNAKKKHGKKKHKKKPNKHKAHTGKHGAGKHARGESK